MYYIRPENFVNVTYFTYGQYEEMVIHYLIQYRKYSNSQHCLEQAVGRSGCNISKLLNNKAMFPHLFIYTNETQ